MISCSAALKVPRTPMRTGSVARNSHVLSNRAIVKVYAVERPGPGRNPRLGHMRETPPALGAYSSAVHLGPRSTPEREVMQPIPSRTCAPFAAGARHELLEKAAEPTAQQKAETSSTSSARFSLVSPAWIPPVGVSKLQQKLQQQVSKASGSISPVFISGDAGLDTLRIATAVHTLGLHEEDVSRPLVLLDCSTPSGANQAVRLLSGLDDLVRPIDSASGTSAHILMEHLPHGTLVLNNLHKAPLEVLSLVDTALSTLLNPKASAAATTPSATAIPGQLLQSLGTRLVLVSQLPLTQLTAQLDAEPSQGLGRCVSITVPPLRARASDIVPLAMHAAHHNAELRGYGSVTLTDAAARKPTGYHFPGNEVELEGLVHRAVMLHPAVATNSASIRSISSFDGAETAVSACDNCSGQGKSDNSSSNSSSLAAAGSMGPALVLDEGDFWAATPDADRRRLDVLELFPWLKPFVTSSAIWPQRLNSITKWLYPLIIASLFLGPQDRDHSAALTVFWAGWWPLVMLSYPFIGRAWCAACPFMITGQQAQEFVSEDASASTASTANPSTAAPGSTPALTQTTQAGDKVTLVLKHWWKRLQLLLPWAWRWKLKSWPADVASYGGWFVVAAFAAILTWEEVWDLPNTAALSGWLLLLITAGAVACSVVYEKRMWCKELCPIGAMNGLFAKLSMTEIRARAGLCAAAACGRPCFKGRKDEASHSFLPGCPMNTRPGAHVDNSDCVMCGNCLRSCAGGSAQWRLRPPAADLWADHSATWHEVSLMYVLLGAVLLHRLPELCDQLGLPADYLLGTQGPHLALSLLLLAAPGAAAWTWNKVGTATTRHFKSRAAAAAADPTGAVLAGSLPSSTAAVPSTVAAVSAEVPFVKLAYSMLPLVWAGTLSHYEELMLTELGLILPRLAASLGIEGDWVSVLPVLGPAPAAVVSAAQGVTIVAGVVLSWALAGKIAEVHVGRDKVGEATTGQRALILATAAELWHLIV